MESSFAPFLHQILGGEVDQIQQELVRKTQTKQVLEETLKRITSEAEKLESVLNAVEAQSSSSSAVQVGQQLRETYRKILSEAWKIKVKTPEYEALRAEVEKHNMGYPFRRLKYEKLKKIQKDVLNDPQLNDLISQKNQEASGLRAVQRENEMLKEERQDLDRQIRERNERHQDFMNRIQTETAELDVEHEELQKFLNSSKEEELKVKNAELRQKLRQLKAAGAQKFKVFKNPNDFPFLLNLVSPNKKTAAEIAIEARKQNLKRKINQTFPQDPVPSTSGVSKKQSFGDPMANQKLSRSHKRHSEVSVSPLAAPPPSPRKLRSNLKRKLIEERENLKAQADYKRLMNKRISQEKEQEQEKVDVNQEKEQRVKILKVEIIQPAKQVTVVEASAEIAKTDVATALEPQSTETEVVPSSDPPELGPIAAKSKLQVADQPLSSAPDPKTVPVLSGAQDSVNKPKEDTNTDVQPGRSESDQDPAENQATKSPDHLQVIEMQSEQAEVPSAPSDERQSAEVVSDQGSGLQEGGYDMEIDGRLSRNSSFVNANDSMDSEAFFNNSMVEQESAGGEAEQLLDEMKADVSIESYESIDFGLEAKKPQDNFFAVKQSEEKAKPMFQM